MKTKIKVSDEAALQEALDEVQKRASKRTVDVELVRVVCRMADERLAGLSNSAKRGATLHYDGAEGFPGAYKYVPESTHFHARHNGKEWVITEIVRATCPNRRSGIDTHLTISDEAKTKLLDSILNF